MAAYADLVRFTSISNGTGPMALQAVVEGYQAPSLAIFDGQVVEYTIVNSITPLEKETGIGTWSNANQALTRLTPRATSSFSTAAGNALVPFSVAGTKTITFGLTSHGIALVAGGGTTLNQVASAPGTYDFVAGGQYNVSYTDRRHAYLKVLGPSPAGLLTATMYIALPDPADGPEGYRIVYEKGESSPFNVVGVGFTAPVAADPANPTTDFLSFPGYTPVDGDPFILRRGTMPGGLSQGIVYFARDSTGVTCKAAAAIGGSAINITSAGSGFFVFKGRKSLTRIDQYQGARIVGTSIRRWEFVEGGQQAFSSFGQDLMKAADAAAAQTVLGPVTSIADGAVVLEDLQVDALASLANTRPGLHGGTDASFLHDLAPPHQMNETVDGRDVSSIMSGGSTRITFTAQAAAAGEITAEDGNIRFQTLSSQAHLATSATTSIPTDIVTGAVAFHLTSITTAGVVLLAKHNDATGFGYVLELLSGGVKLTVYTGPTARVTVFQDAPIKSGWNAFAFSYKRSTSTMARWASAAGSRYSGDLTAVPQAANWIGQATLTARLGVWIAGTGANDVRIARSQEYSETGIASREKLENLVREMEQHAARKIGHGDLALPLLQSVETASVVPRGVGADGDLKSAWVSGFGVTGSNPVTGVTESHGLGTALAVSGSPTLQSNGSVRIVCNGATSSGLLSKGPPLTNDLLTNRNILVMDVNSDVAGDWNTASLFRAFDSGNNFGFNLVSNGIVAYASSGPITSIFTPKRGRQRIGVYVEFGTTSLFRYISVGRDENARARPLFKVAASFASLTQNPTGQDTLNVWVGEGNLIAGRAGTHDIYGWRLLNGVPSGLSDDSIDALLLGEIEKLARETDPLLRVLPTPVDSGNWTSNVNGQGFFLYNQSIGLASAITGTTANVDPLHRGRLVPLSNVAGWTLTILNTTPPGDYYYKDTGGAGGLVQGDASVTLYTMRADGGGLEAITTPNLKVLPHGRVWFRVEQNSGTAPILVAGGDLDVPTVFTDPVTFIDTVKVSTLRGTTRDIVAGASIVAADNGKLLFATTTGTASIPAVSTLCPVSGDAFLCTVINATSPPGNYVLDGPGAANVTLAPNEAGTITCRNVGACRIYKSLGVVTS